MTKKIYKIMEVDPRDAYFRHEESYKRVLFSLVKPTRPERQPFFDDLDDSWYSGKTYPVGESPDEKDFFLAVKLQEVEI